MNPWWQISEQMTVGAGLFLILCCHPDANQPAPTQCDNSFRNDQGQMTKDKLFK